MECCWLTGLALVEDIFFLELIMTIVRVAASRSMARLWWQ